MAAEVGPIAGYVKGYDDDKLRRAAVVGLLDKSSAPITRDLLGGLHGIESQELDLDLQVPLGWEKRLDLKSGKVYLQRCSSASSSSSSGERVRPNQGASKFQDLNSPPSPSMSLLDEANLDLKLRSSPVARSSCGGYQSVCTLDKVKSALEKAERDPPARKRPPFWGSSPSAASNSSSSTSVVETQLRKEETMSSSSPVAAGCPCCLLYVLIMKSNPRCPRCDTVVPMPTSKRPRIDLNISI
ncbi:hypothetical protein MLD38_021935 [Melastoma candidum]|uniref:Uncharacterized protein n=1 Tax=Melastoma candidum TaxID=119954 RepID=A0ACB9QI47_9MYRT|nr:hypothetical protein MLD38_021935 [Melastoma candidum]